MRRLTGGGASRTEMEVIKLRKTWNNLVGGRRGTVKMHLVASFIDQGQHVATYRWWSRKYGWQYETKPAYLYAHTWRLMEKWND